MFLVNRCCEWENFNKPLSNLPIILPSSFLMTLQFDLNHLLILLPLLRDSMAGSRTGSLTQAQLNIGRVRMPSPIYMDNCSLVSGTVRDDQEVLLLEEVCPGGAGWGELPILFSVCSLPLPLCFPLPFPPLPVSLSLSLCLSLCLSLSLSVSPSLPPTC